MVVFVVYSQSFIWTLDGKSVDSGMRVPFVVDICRATFEQLEQLLSELYDSVGGPSDRPPPTQFSECLMSSVLSLLKLQVRQHYHWHYDIADIHIDCFCHYCIFVDCAEHIFVL